MEVTTEPSVRSASGLVDHVAAVGRIAVWDPRQCFRTEDLSVTVGVLTRAI